MGNREMDHCREQNGQGFLSTNYSYSSPAASKHSQEEHEDDENAMMEDLRKGSWTEEEDQILSSYIAKHGEGRWNSLARCSGLRRTGKSCRLRWLNYLRPDVRRGNISLEEQLLILELHSRWGNRWSKIAKYLPGRTDNEIKNYWRTQVQKHAKQLKCDVNSQQFKDTIRYLWMPRLVERIETAAQGSTNNDFTAAISQVNAIATTVHTQYEITKSSSSGGYEPYDPFSNQVSPISDLIDDNHHGAAANNYQDIYSKNKNNYTGYSDSTTIMKYDCNNIYDQTGLLVGNGGGGGDQMHPNDNYVVDDQMMLQNGGNLWNVDDFLFNSSQQYH